MLAIQFRQPGPPEVLEAVQLPDPKPGPGEILVRNKAVGLNFIDTYQRSGFYKVALPAPVGLEGAGVVEAVGEGVTEPKVGDRVAYYSGRAGAYAELTVIAAERAAVVPPDVDFDTAAASLMKGMTAWMLATRLFPIQAGDSILVHAAAGGVGSFLTQWCTDLGASVIGVVGSADKVDQARANGCRQVIVLRDEDLAARVREVTAGKGVRAVFDSIGAATFEASMNSLAKFGWMVIFGAASGAPPSVDPARLMKGGSLILTRPTVADFTASRADFLQASGAVFSMLAAGKLKVNIGQRYALKDAARAHRALEGRATVGATVLLP